MGTLQTNLSLMILPGRIKPSDTVMPMHIFKMEKAEKAIWDLQDIARTMLLHVEASWPDSIHLSLWPYEMRVAVHIMNHLLDEAAGSSCIETLS